VTKIATNSVTVLMKSVITLAFFMQRQPNTRILMEKLVKISTITMEILTETTTFLTVFVKMLCYNINISPQESTKCIFSNQKFHFNFVKIINLSQNLSKFSVTMYSDRLKSVTKFVKSNCDGLSVHGNIYHSRI